MNIPAYCDILCCLHMAIFSLLHKTAESQFEMRSKLQSKHVIKRRIACPAAGACVHTVPKHFPAVPALETRTVFALGNINGRSCCAIQTILLLCGQCCHNLLVLFNNTECTTDN